MKFLEMATQFEMDSNEQNDFLAIAEKSNYQVRPVQQIAALEENLPGLPGQRNIVRWAFEEGHQELETSDAFL